MKSWVRLFFIVVCLMNIGVYASTQISKPIVCNSVYALCNAASCKKIPNDNGKVLCHCSVWHGKNIGYSSCNKRAMQVSQGEKSILSTFSFGGGHYRYMTCKGGTLWASCLDQPCYVDKNSIDGRRAYCTCKSMHSQKPFVTFAGYCNQKYCGKAIWSGATVSGNQLLTKVLSHALGDPNVLKKAVCVK